MEHRKLGATGISVSPLCLGAMMFGAWGNTDHDDSIRDHPRARSTPASTSSTPPTCTRAASPRRSSARRSPAAAATRSCSRPRPTAGCTTTDPNAVRQLAPLARQRGREQPQTAENRLDRPLPDPPPRARHRHRPDARRAQRPRARPARCARSAPRRSRPGRSSQAQWAAERRGRERFVCEQPPYSMLIRAIERDVLPACEQYGMGVIPWSPLAGGWLSGRYTQRRRVARTRAGARR